MPSIFISYRRDDDPGYARLLYERLQTWFPGEPVFMDVEEIPLGASWRKILTDRISTCEVLIVLIGRAWLSATASDGTRRLDDAEDFVRWEIAEALRLGKRVIPVLLSPALLPAAKDLPQDIAALADLQYQTLAHSTFEQDIQTLVERISGRGGWLIRLLDGLARLGKIGALVGVIALAFAWTNLFDLLGLDTRTASFTMLAGDILFESPLSDALLLVSIQPRPDETERLSTTRRADYAQLIHRASLQGAKAVVFDITVTEPSNSDDALRNAVAKARKRGTDVVFGFKELAGQEPAAAPELARAGAALGFACVGEKLGEAMLATLALHVKDRAYGSLPLQAVYHPEHIGQLKAGKDFLTITKRNGEPDAVRFSTRETTSRLDSDCPAKVEGSEITRLLIPLSHRERLREPTRRTTMEDLLSQTPAFPLAGRLLVVGAEHPFDRLVTRMDVSNTPRYGFEFQADAINALLTDQIVSPLGFGAQWLVAAGMILLASGYRLWRLGKSHKFDYIALPLACMIYMGVAILLYAKLRLLMDGLYHLAAFLVTWWALGAVERRWNRDNR